MKQFKWNITDLILSNAWISYPACVGHITSLHQSLLCCIHERTVHNQDLRELWLHVSCCNQKRTTSYEKLPETREKYISLFNKMAHKKIKWALFLLAFFFCSWGESQRKDFELRLQQRKHQIQFDNFPHNRKQKFTNRPLHEWHGFFNFWLRLVRENPSTQLEKIP